MPLYDYTCTICGATKSDVFKKYENKDEAIFCETCGLPMERSVGAAAFVLKGKGWYKDGYTKS